MQMQYCRVSRRIHTLGLHPSRTRVEYGVGDVDRRCIKEECTPLTPFYFIVPLEESSAPLTVIAYQKPSNAGLCPQMS